MTVSDIFHGVTAGRLEAGVRKQSRIGRPRRGRLAMPRGHSVVCTGGSAVTRPPPKRPRLCVMARQSAVVESVARCKAGGTGMAGKRMAARAEK